jgi:hypothetical protein
MYNSKNMGKRLLNDGNVLTDLHKIKDEGCWNVLHNSGQKDMRMWLDEAGYHMAWKKK